jgi:hypothetical protein
MFSTFETLECPVLEKGPWSLRESVEHGHSLCSEDFKFDVMLHIAGDFDSPEAKLKYAEYLKDALNTGCQVEQALHSSSFRDLLPRLQRAYDANGNTVFIEAVKAIAGLSSELAEALKRNEFLEVHNFGKTAANSQMPSEMAQALMGAMRGKASVPATPPDSLPAITLEGDSAMLHGQVISAGNTPAGHYVVVFKDTAGKFHVVKDGVIRHPGLDSESAMRALSQYLFS